MLPLRFIQATSAGGLSGTLSLAYVSTTTQGSAMIAMVLVVTGTLGGTFAATDTAGNTWFDVAPSAHYSSGTVEATIMICNSNKTADTNTVTLTYSHTHTGGQIILSEYANGAATPFDAASTWIVTSSGTAQTFNPVTASGQNEQIFVFASTGSTSDISAVPIGYNIRITPNPNSAQLIDGFVSAAGSYTPSWTYASSTNSIAVSLSIKSSATIGTTAATPSFSPVAGTYTSPQSVTISDTTPADILFIQAAPNAGSGITTCQFISQNTTPGNAYILTVYSSSGNQVTAVNDTESNSWSLAGRQAGQAGDGDEIEIWYALNVVGGTQPTVTITCASGLGTNATLTLHEYSGIASVSAFDQTNGATGTTGTLASGAVLPTTAGQLVFSYFMSHTTGTGGTGLFSNAGLVWAPMIPRYFTNCLTGGHQSASFDFVQGGVQSLNPSISTLGTFDWIALTVTFKAAASSARMDYSTATATSPLVNIVTDGDSFTQNDDTVANSTGATQIGTTYQQTAQTTLGSNYYFRNVGIGGQPGGLSTSGVGQFGTYGCCLNRAPLGVDLFYVPGILNICFLECGLHDLLDYSPMTAAQIYSQTITPYVTARQAMGWKVVVCTLPSWISGVDSQRLSLNTLITGNAAGADGICDWAGNANIGATNAYQNSTYFLSDGHLTQLSNTTIIAPLVVASIQALVTAPTSTKYTGAVSVTSSQTLSAVASSFNYLASTDASAAYVIAGSAGYAQQVGAFAIGI